MGLIEIMGFSPEFLLKDRNKWGNLAETIQGRSLGEDRFEVLHSCWEIRNSPVFIAEMDRRYKLAKSESRDDFWKLSNWEVLLDMGEAYHGLSPKQLEEISARAKPLPERTIS